MAGFPSPFSNDGGDPFDDRNEFVPEHLPAPGEFLEGQRVLEGRDHVAFHRTTREVFEERTVYDVTFGYNLARLNADARHESAGYRYAEETGDAPVLRAEFTPTTPFCPQSQTLAVASFRAWNALRDRHDYDVVKVRVRGTHHRSEAINDRLRDLEAEFVETGTVPDAPDDDPTSTPVDPSEGSEGPGHGPGAPF